MANIEIPDFNKINNIIDNINSLAKEKAKLKFELETKEASIMIDAITNAENHLVEGKPPSATFVQQGWKVNGFDGELIPIREKYYAITEELESYKRILDMYKLAIEVWRTESANERNILI